MRNRNRSAFLGALAIIAGAGSALQHPPSATSATTAQEARQAADTKAALGSEAADTKAALRRRYGAYTPHRHGYPNGPGWTQAQVQRRARKARNARRNRLAHR